MDEAAPKAAPDLLMEEGLLGKLGKPNPGLSSGGGNPPTPEIARSLVLGVKLKATSAVD